MALRVTLEGAADRRRNELWRSCEHHHVLGSSLSLFDLREQAQS